MGVSCSSLSWKSAVFAVEALLIVCVAPPALPKWDCGGPRWMAVLEATRRVFVDNGCERGSPQCVQDYRLLGTTARQDEALCPVASSVSRLAHLRMTYQRDWHGDEGKVWARPIALLQLPFSADLALLTDAEHNLPRAKGSMWYELFFFVLASLSGDLCPLQDPDMPPRNHSISDYHSFCQSRPWTIGCRLPLPSCDSPSPWRRDGETTVNSCWGVSDAVALARCARESMPSTPTRLLDLVVPRQQNEWLAVKNVLTVQHHTIERMIEWPVNWGAAEFRQPQPPCVGVKPLPTSMPAALCPIDWEGSFAPSSGHVERVQAAQGRLEVVVFAGLATELPGCGTELEFHIHIDTPNAPGKFNSCVGIACREQCASWEAGNFLRFECVLRGKGDYGADLHFPAATLSGHVMEPSLHTRVTCRLPRSLALPSWLSSGGGGDEDSGLNLELRELDGVLGAPLPVRLCRYRRAPPESRYIAMGTRPLVGAGEHQRLLSDWLSYHAILGADHVFVYDGDGSAEKLLEVPGRSNFTTYVPMLPKQIGPRFSSLGKEFWRVVGGNACVETLLVNHCLALAKSAGFEWFVFLRGIDKFLHSDYDAGPDTLRRFLAERADVSGFLVQRRDCGRRQDGVAQGAPVFDEFTGCEPLVPAGKLGKDVSFVPMMRTSEALLVLPNQMVMRRVEGAVAVAPMAGLRAQHFVRAFEEGGVYGKRHYDTREMRDERFPDEDHSMTWATPLLRSNFTVASKSV